MNIECMNSIHFFYSMLFWVPEDEIVSDIE